MTMTRRRSAAAALITGSLVAAAAQTPTIAAAYAFSSPPCSGRLLTPSLPTTRTSSCVSLQATRADDPRSSSGSSSGTNNKNPYGGTGSYIPGRGSAQDDEAWFAQQVRMAETEKEFGSQQQQQKFNCFGGQQQPQQQQQQQQQRRNASSPPKAAAAASSATRRGTSWARPNNPPPPPPAKRGDTNSRSPQAIPSGSSASSSWFGADRQAVTMPGAEKSSSAAVPQQSMARLSGPKPTVPPVPPPGIVGSGRGTTERVPYQPSPSAAAAAARGGSASSSSTRSIGGNERRSPGAVPFRGSSRSDDAVAPGAQRTPQQQQQQQQPQKKKDNWFRQLYLRQSEGQQQQQQQQQRTSTGPTPVPGVGNSKPGSTQRVAAPIGSSPRTRNNNNYDSAAAAARKIQIKNTVAYAQSAIVGAFVGTWSIFPFTAFHYLVFTDYDYTTFAQWEWDLVASSVQGACFAVIYRYAMRQDLADKWVQRKVVLASVLLRSFVRVTVPFECAAGDDYPLYCADSAPLFVVNGGMMAEIAVNFAEGMALFGVTAIAMNWLLERNKIARY